MACIEKNIAHEYGGDKTEMKSSMVSALHEYLSSDAKDISKKSFAPSVTRLRPDLDRRKFYALNTYGTL